MASFATVVDEVLDRLAGDRFDPRLIGRHVIDTGPVAERARGIASRLNAARHGRPKEPVVLWAPAFAAITRRGRWVYVARTLASRLSDDGLAFVLAHEIGHHDLRHLSLPFVAASRMGHSQRIELDADRYGVQLVARAGFDPEGALEAMSPEVWVEDPEDPPVEPSDAFRAWIDRFRRSHPSMPVRREAIRRAIEGCR